jgi:hypothetical protein
MNRPTLSSLRRRALAAALALAALPLAGCGGTGSVSGKVTYNGAPLPYGSVQFLTPGGAFVADIGPDGSYSLSGVPAGPARVSVTCQDPRYAEHMRQLAAHGRDPRSPAPRGRFDDFNKIPSRFNDPTTSGLAFEVQSGSQAWDINLK